jgi:hypothetical protein
VNSSEDFINIKQQTNIVKSLQEPLKEVNSILQNKEEIEKEISLISKYQKQFIITSLKKLLEKSIDNDTIELIMGVTKLPED